MDAGYFISKADYIMFTFHKSIDGLHIIGLSLAILS